MTPNSRSYLNRWIQPDDIIPDPGNPIDLDRYAYARNNPTRYIDPSGHRVECGANEYGCSGGKHDAKLLAYKLVEALSRKAREKGAITFYAGLTRRQKSILAEGEWSSGAFNDEITTQTSDLAGKFPEDPAVWVVVGVNAYRWGSAILSTIAENKGWTVYQLVENGITRYIGMTGDYWRRAGEHLQSRGWAIEPIPGLENLSEFDARAVEQVLIEHYGLANLYNKINSIAASNTIYQQAIQRGTEILRNIGFFP